MDLKHHDVKYKRWIYLTVTFVIILAGLASRKYGNALPKFIAEYIGDTLWAAMVYWGLRFLFPSASILKVAAISLLFSANYTRSIGRMPYETPRSEHWSSGMDFYGRI